jgi:hypothetical protein
MIKLSSPPRKVFKYFEYLEQEAIRSKLLFKRYLGPKIQESNVIVKMNKTESIKSFLFKVLYNRRKPPGK